MVRPVVILLGFVLIAIQGDKRCDIRGIEAEKRSVKVVEKHICKMMKDEERK